ncbi:MAG: substrate-binding domain-containing protein [Sphingomonadaceae bacterium]
MRNLKTSLLAATIIAGVSSPAYAQFSFPTVQLDGVGATTISDINVKVLNCIGVDSPQGNNGGTGSTTPITLADYTPTTPTVANPEHRCSTGDNIYNGTTTFTGEYLATGSGVGRQQWRNFDNQFRITFNSLGNVVRPFGSNPFPTAPWTNVQYAFSESPATPADIADYETDNLDRFADTTSPGNFVKTDNTLTTDADFDINGKVIAGPAIQIPLYVIPIAVAYNPVYGINVANQNMNFNVKVPVIVNAVNTGGLRLTKADYCGIFNGTVLNWNNAGIQTRNGNQPLYDPLTDSASRWSSEGAPIRIVGRADRSGGTDVTTRALTAQCGITVPNGGTNRFERAAESLPYNTVGGPDIRPLRPDTNYFPGVTQSAMAGVTQSLGGGVWGNNGVFCDISAVTATNCAAASVVNTPGLFIVADGSTRLEAAIRDGNAANGSLVTLASGVRINGKVGYIGGDFTAPTPGRSLHSAALQVGVGAAFAMPNAVTSGQAFGTVFPPQSIAGSGFYNVSDSRNVFKDLTNVALPTDTAAQIAAKVERVNRSNPLHWVNILYPANFDLAGNPTLPARPTLANPTAGYPVVGTANILTYTCFSSQAKVHGIANFLQYVMGRVTKKNAIGGSPASINLSANTFPGTGAPTLGILSKSNTATIPAGWRTAVVETFLKYSTQSASGSGTAAPQLNSLNLWIQTAQPALASGPASTLKSNTALNNIDNGQGGATALVAGVPTPIDNRNPNCIQGFVAGDTAVQTDTKASLPGA